jgi:signal transduction histidine kinase
MSKRTRPDSLTRLRLQLTGWSVATFAAILILLGGGLFIALHRQFSAELRESLKGAVAELERAALIREMEAHAAGSVVDAVDELRVPDRFLYLLDTTSAPIKPDTASEWIREAAKRAASQDGLYAEFSTSDDVKYELYAEPFALASGNRVVAVAVANEREMQGRFEDLLTAFSIAALVAMALVAGGGWLLMRKSTEPVERSNELMRRFMADAAHELKTPISVARTRAEVALQNPRDAAAYESALKGIAAETHHIGRIVEDLVTLSRADAGERPVSFKPLYLDDVVIEAANAAKFLATSRGVDMRVEKFEESPVNGDAELLRQLVLIFLDNAIKFAPSGSTVSVRVGMVGGHAEVEIQDEGPGISPDQLPHIFERFYRGSASRNQSVDEGSPGRGHGAGLGLAIAKWISDAHGGNIKVSSVEGEGSRFLLQLPRANL